MQQLFIESLILILALFGILITIFQIFCYRTERKLDYKVIRVKDKVGKNIEIIISADDYDANVEKIIEDAVSQYYVKN